MRIRQVKPAFWTDKVMASLPDSARLTFIGLWMLADDSGWLEWDVEQAGAELAPFENVKRRERRLASDLDALVDRGRVVRHDCGCLHVPHLEEHQRVSGVRNYRARDAHAKHLVRSATQSSLSDSPGTERNGKGRERNVTERNGMAAPAADETSEFRRKMAAVAEVVA